MYIQQVAHHTTTISILKTYTKIIAELHIPILITHLTSAVFLIAAESL